ncbi:flagellar basal body P-ring formation chaperone FlgA [Desulfurobacterium sp.]
MRFFLLVLSFFILTVSPSSGETVKGFIRHYVKVHFPDKAVVFVSAPDRELPSDSVEVSLLSEDRYYLRFRIFVRDGKREEVIHANVRVASLKPVVVASRDILPKTLIRKDDLAVKKVPEIRASMGFDSVKDVVGKRAKRLIKAGSVIKPADLTPDFKVFKNAPVKVIYTSGNIKIEMIGQALQNGALGDIIEVKNISTGKKLLCRVIGSGVVEFVP